MAGEGVLGPGPGSGGRKWGGVGHIEKLGDGERVNAELKLVQKQGCDSCVLRGNDLPSAVYLRRYSIDYVWSVYRGPTSLCPAQVPVPEGFGSCGVRAATRKERAYDGNRRAAGTCCGWCSGALVPRQLGQNEGGRETYGPDCFR